MIRRIPVKVSQGMGISCLSEDCLNERECANHRTAGDFRGEDGFTPEMSEENKVFFCSKKETRETGALVFYNGELINVHVYYQILDNSELMEE